MAVSHIDVINPLAQVPGIETQKKYRSLHHTETNYSFNINPLCASPPQLCKPARPHATRVSYLEINFPTMPDCCLLQYNQRKISVLFAKNEEYVIIHS